MKAKNKLKARTGFIGRLDRKRGTKLKPIPIKKSRVKELEDRLSYQVVKAENFPALSSSRKLWMSRAEITRKELKKVSGV